MNVGLDMLDAPYTATVHLPPLPKPGSPRRGLLGAAAARRRSESTIYEPAMYAEWEATPWRGGRIVPGIRLDYTKDTGPGTSTRASWSGKTSRRTRARR